MARIYNFSAGPAVLPEEVLKEAAAEMLDYNGTGMSVMEMSHRSKAYDTIIKEAEQDLRDLLNIPDNYKVLFVQGGASLVFASVPMNLMKNKTHASHGEPSASPKVARNTSRGVPWPPNMIRYMSRKHTARAAHARASLQR